MSVSVSPDSFPHHPERVRPLLVFCLPVAMVKSTLVVRASDALPLAASVDDEQVCWSGSTLPHNVILMASR